MDEPSASYGTCHSCGATVAATDNYCQQCGAQLTNAAGRATESPDGGTVDIDETDSQAAGAEWDDRSAQRVSGPGAPGSKRGRESPFRAIGTAVGLSVAGLVVPLIALSILGVILFILGAPTGAVLAGTALLQFAWFVGLGLWYLRNRGYDWDAVREYLGIEVPSLKQVALVFVTWLGIIITAAVVLTIVTQVAAQFVGPDNAEPAENSTGETIAANPEIVVFAVLGMLLVVGPAEETLFRGVIQNRLRESLSKIPAILIASALFAAAHVFALAGGGSATGIAITMSVLFVTGLGLGWIYEYTENLVAPALLHGFHNSVVVVVTVQAATGLTFTELVVAVV